MIQYKRENYRLQMRRKEQEELFQRKRLIQYSTLPGNVQELQNLLHQNDPAAHSLMQILNQSSDELQFVTQSIVTDLLLYIEQATDVNYRIIAFQCLNNIFFYNTTFDCYDFLVRQFQQSNIINIKQMILKCLANFIFDNPQYIRQAQLDFMGNITPEYYNEISFLVNLMSERAQFQDLIRALECLEQIIQDQSCGPDGIDALKTIFKNCNNLELDDLINESYKDTIKLMLNQAEFEVKMIKPLLVLARRSTEENKINLYYYGYSKLIKAEYIKKSKYFAKLILAFSDDNHCINEIFMLFDDYNLHKYLLQYKDGIILSVICNSIIYGNTFIDFIKLNIIDYFIDILKDGSREDKVQILETIYQILQKDELSMTEFRWIALKFSQVAFLNALPYDSPELAMLSDSISQLITDSM